MATENITTILQVELDAAKVAQDLGELSKRIADVKKDQEDLNKQFKAGEVSAADYNKKMAGMKDELTWLQKEQKGLIATTKLLDKETAQYSDTLNGQRQKLADMQKAYDSLDREMREGEGGKQFLKEIQQQTEVVQGLEEATGRHQRNVGNYPKILQSVIPGFDKANAMLGKMGISLNDLQIKGTGAFNGLGASMNTFGKALLTPPIAIITVILSAIILAVQKVSEAFKKNDDAMTELQKAFAIFQPIGDGVAKVFDLVAQGLAKIASKAAEVVQWIAKKVAPAYAEAAEKAQQLVQAQDDLEEAERKYTEESARRSARVAELRANVTETEKYSEDQRRQFLEEAIRLERQNLEQSKANAAERLRILEETAKKESDTSDETKDKIAQARAAMYQAEEQYYTGVRRLQAQLTQFEADERKKRVDEWDQEWQNMRLLAETEVATAAAKFEELKATAQAALESLNEDEEEEEVPTLDEVARNMFGLDAEGVEYFRQLLDQGVDFAKAKTMAITDQTSRMTKSWGTAFGALSGTFNQMADALGEFAGESEEAAKAQKAFALAGILTNQAQSISEGALAIAKGIESASGVPFPGNIPTIIAVVAQIGSMIAGVMSSIAQAKQVFSQASDAGNFATGGTIGGNSYTGDRLIAHVNSGEGIYTGTQANNLLQEIANNPQRGGLDYERLGAVMASAVAVLPAPVVVYRELEEFGDRVSTINEIAGV